MDEVSRFDQLCNGLFSPQQEVRLKAESEIKAFKTVEAVPKLQAYLSASQNGMTFLFISGELTNLYTDNWSVFSKESKLELRNFLITFIAKNADKVPGSIMSSILKLLARIAKLGWLEDQDNRDLPEQIKKYFVQSPKLEVSTLGLNLLNELMLEMNTLISKQNTTVQRKISISFRDLALRGLFETSIFSLKELIRQQQPNDVLVKSTLQLCLNCLRYDFVGIYPDEASDDAATIQVPSSWRPLFEESNTVELLWKVFNSLQGSEIKAKILEILVLLSCVRRSLFTGDEEREAYLSRFISGIIQVLDNRKNILSDDDCYHQFCRLLTRLKSNFQLKELVACKDYPNFIKSCAVFTVESFTNPISSSHCLYYLMNFWSRLVASHPYLGKKIPFKHLFSVPKILEEYISSRLNDVVLIKQNDLDDPLDEAERLDEYLDSVPSLFHFNYEKLCPMFQTFFDTINQKLSEAMNKNNFAQVQIAQDQLAWIIYMFGSIVGKRSYSSNNDEMENIDGEMAGRILQCSQFVSHRLMKDTNAVNEKSLLHIETATLYFMKDFKQLYLNDTIVTYTKIYETLKKKIEVTDQISLLNLFINKIANNLKVWAKSKQIIDETMDLFNELSLGYSSTKLTAKLETIKYILHNHSADQFQFLNESLHFRSRTVFFSILTKLLFADECTETNFLNFVAPFGKIANQLLQIENLNQFRQDNVKFALVGLFRDLRGVVTSCNNKQKYGFFFDWVFPKYFPLFLRTAQAWSDTPVVINSLLKFLFELCYSRSSRIEFPSSSPKGILLFKEISKILIAYGMTAEKINVKQDLYQEKYKGIMVALQVLTRTLEGNYCCFGVFDIYKDSCLIEVINMIVKLSLQVSLKDIKAYPKFCKAYFSFLEILFGQHIETTVTFDTQIFLQLVNSFEDGVASDEISLSSQMCGSLDKLCTFYFKSVTKKDQYSQMLTKHFQNSQILPKLLSQTLKVIIFEECRNQWSMSRAVLSLIATNPQYFEEIKKQIINSVADSKKKQMSEAFTRLMDKVELNVEEGNKDK
eukprot:gene8717-663_t